VPSHSRRRTRDTHRVCANKRKCCCFVCSASCVLAWCIRILCGHGQHTCVTRLNVIHTLYSSTAHQTRYRYPHWAGAHVLAQATTACCLGCGLKAVVGVTRLHRSLSTPAWLRWPPPRAHTFPSLLLLPIVATISAAEATCAPGLIALIVSKKEKPWWCGHSLQGVAGTSPCQPAALAEVSVSTSPAGRLTVACRRCCWWLGFWAWLATTNHD
jgi:hypothetical protein